MEEKSLIKKASQAKETYGESSIEHVEALDRLAFYYRQNGNSERAHEVLLDVEVCNCLKDDNPYAVSW